MANITKQLVTIENQFSNDLTKPDITEEYYCFRTIKSKGFTLLMKCVMLYNNYPHLYHSLSKSLISEQINMKNIKGKTAFTDACDYLNTESSELTIKYLLDVGVNMDAMKTPVNKLQLIFNLQKQIILEKNKGLKAQNIFKEAYKVGYNVIEATILSYYSYNLN